MKNKEIEELLNELKDKYSYEPYDTTGKVYTTISYEEGQLLLSYIEQSENTIDDMTNISYKDYDSWLKNKDYVKDLESFANQINYDMNPITTLAYRTSIKNAIKILVRRLKETYTEDTVNELKQKNEQLENNRDKAIEYVEKHSDKIKKIVIPKIDFDYKKLLDILKGDSDD